MASTTSSSSALTSPSAAAATPPPGPGTAAGPTSSPLLFFVALGFGVVFTNLWIIVGVKYCFRYNQRNRRLQQDENGEPIDMTTMPPRHRRRREKKLMTMDEVNERFPLLKYKAWMTSRAEEGLPTAGGVAAPSESRAASLRNVDGVLANARKSNDSPRPTTPVPNNATEAHGDSPASVKSSPEIDTETVHDVQQNAFSAHPEKPSFAEHASPTITQGTNDTTVDGARDEDMDDDDHIHMAVPTEMMANPGDACAICIDTLEDDDDVRGLTCGHAFHASCLDPWLTSRRACCPLCKADYFVPKPRPEGESAEAEAARERTRARVRGTALPRPPPSSFQRQAGTRLLFPSRFRPHGIGGSAPDSPGHSARPRHQRQQRSALPPTQQPAPAAESQPTETWRSRMRGFVPSVGVPGRWRRNTGNGGDNANASTAPEIHTESPAATTPGQLEAGHR